jgi:Zinc finger, C3HC4 type (RING finger)
MSSSATSASTTGKLTSPQPASTFAPSFSSNNTEPTSKRSSSSNLSGSGSATRHTAQARNQQPLRKQHKAHRRAKLADDDAMAEADAMRPFNSRRGQTSITHLMNFSLPPSSLYQSHHRHHPNSHRLPRRNPTWGLGSGYHAVDKARYVHANYRFIVRPDKEYHAQAVDADIHLPWDSVLQILGSVETQSTSCPICLSPPVAARMAKCGHIFCLPCLIRYMHSTDETAPFPEKRARWKKCPICEDSVYISETRPVRWFAGQEASFLREGGDVLLKLMKREPSSTLALPRDAAEGYGPHDDIPWYHVAEMMDYARFMKGGEDYMSDQYDQEIAELETQEKEDELMFGDDNTWFRKAVNAIEDAKQKLSGIGNPPSTEGKQKAIGAIETVPESWEEDASAEAQNTTSQSSLTGAMQGISISGTETRSKRPPYKHAALPNRPPTHSFFFYNALPNFYLSALDIRILKAAFGDFSAFPSSILPRVEHISTGHVVDDDLRKRAKYLAHMPYGCEVSFLECDWTDLISPSILEIYKEDILRRRRRNQDKEAREERDRIRAEKEEDEKRMASIRRRRPSLIEKSFSESDFQPLVSREVPGSSPGDSGLASTPPWGAQRQYSSFATLATPGSSPDAHRTVWGTTAIAPASPPLTAAPEPAQPIDDGWLQGWEKDLLDESDALAMVNASVQAESSTKSGSVSGQGSGKKGKKKKITLMSTNARRAA